MIPAQLGIPGGPEMLLPLLVFGLVLAAVVVFLYRLGNDSAKVEELDSRVDRLEDENDSGN